MSSWGPKLEKKLNALADAASKESLQTLANWVGFNRKHAAVFSKTFCNGLLGTTTDARQWLYWQVLHEVLLANEDNPEKWERASDLRTTLGEAAVIPALEGLGTRALTDKIEGLWKQWDNQNVFGGPTLIGQIRRLISSSRGTTTTATSTGGKEETIATTAAPSSKPAEASEESKTSAATTIPATTTATATATAPEETKEEIQAAVDSVGEQETLESSSNRRNSLSSVGSASKQRRGSMSSLTGAEIEYDFESKNVPVGVVDSREFLDPCTAVATLQIARDVRNDASVQLNSMLVNLPEDIAEKAHNIEKGESKVEDLDAATIRDYAIRMPKQLLELDLDEQYQSIVTLQDIVRKQRAAREKLIYLLLKSRCQFGSKEAAKLYMDLEATSEKLKKRKQLLVDGLELEGLDSELDTTDFDKPLQNLPPLAWYQPTDDNNESGDNTDANKKQRVE